MSHCSLLHFQLNIQRIRTEVIFTGMDPRPHHPHHPHHHHPHPHHHHVIFTRSWIRRKEGGHWPTWRREFTSIFTALPHQHFDHYHHHHHHHQYHHHQHHHHHKHFDNHHFIIVKNYVADNDELFQPTEFFVTICDLQSITVIITSTTVCCLLSY